MHPNHRLPDDSRDAVAFWSLTAFVVCLFTVPAEWFPGIAALRPALLTSGLAAVAMLIGRIARRAPIYIEGVRGISLLAIVALSFASISWSVVPEISTFTALELTKLAAIYFTLVNVVTTPRRATLLAGAIVLASMLTSMGVIQWWLDGEKLVDGFRSRWIGVYADPNHMAMDLGLVVPIALAFVIRSETRPLMRLLSIAAAGLAMTAIVLSFSRGGFLGLVAGLAVWGFREKAHRFATFAVGGVLAACLLMFAPSSFWERNETVADFRADVSAMGRVHAWEVAARMSQDRPLLGTGVGAFQYAWPLYAPPGAEHEAFVAHNIFLDVVGELGWTGLALFLVFFGGTTASVFAASDSRSVGWLARALTASIVGYTLCDLFSGYILSTHFYLLFGLGSCVHRLALMENAPGWVPARPVTTTDTRSTALVWGG